MAAIPRSRSAPHVGAPLPPFLAPKHESQRPQLPRHRTSLALTELYTSYTPPRSGYYTPRAERAEDPFNLGGFFPSLPVAETRLEEDEEWQWLRGDDALVPNERRPVEDWEKSEGPFLDKSEDEETDEIIRREDKLGVLSIPAIFMSTDMETASAYDHLLSPPATEFPADDDALFESYHALRQAYCASMWADVENVRLGDLPAPPRDAGDEQLGVRAYESVFAQKLGTLLGLFGM